MVRMIDIVRGTAALRPTDRASASRPACGAAPPRTAESVPIQFAADAIGPRARTAHDDERGKQTDVAVGSAPSAVTAHRLFEEWRQFLYDVRDRVGVDSFPWTELERHVSGAIASLGQGGDLFWLASDLGTYAGPDYLSLHQTRVAILALRLAANLGYGGARLANVGMAASLMDVALGEAPNVCPGRVRALSFEEPEYRVHPHRSADIVERWTPPSEAIVEAVRNHHEREHGQGFPRGLDGSAIHPDAKILGIVDTYATLTIPPAPQPRLRPHEAIREIFREKHTAFSPVLIKAFLSEISLFPPGTLVRLNTGEVGQVSAVNRNCPLRPCVTIHSDSRGRPLTAADTINLSEAPFLYITGSVTEVGQ